MLLETPCSVRLSEKVCVVSTRDEVTGQSHPVFLANLATLHNVSVLREVFLHGLSLGVPLWTDLSLLLRFPSLLLLLLLWLRYAY